MPHTVKNVFFDSSRVRCLMYDADLNRDAGTSGDLEFPETDTVGYHVSLHLREEANVNADSEGIADRDDLVFVQESFYCL